MRVDESRSAKTRRGFVFGELLIALLLLTVAVSSLAALMYSVSRRPVVHADTECSASSAALGKCVPAARPQIPESKLLRSGCSTQSVFDQRNCKDTIMRKDPADAVVIKPRTDSAAMALLAKRQKEQRDAQRTDRGFIR